MTRRIQTGFALLAFAATSPLLFAEAADIAKRSPDLATAQRPSSEVEGALEVLRKNGVATETEGVLTFLERLQPDPKQQAEITKLVGQLTDPEFARRQDAFRALLTFGEAARSPLIEAARSGDPELKSLAQKILGRLESGADVRQSLTLAALEALRSRRDPKAAPAILATLALPADPHVHGVAAEALWASAASGNSRIFADALQPENPSQVRAAAIVALEVASGDEAVARIVPLLADGDAVIRLAAARALIDREPKRAVEALVALAGEESLEMAWQSDALLRMKTEHRPAFEGGRSLGEAWKSWFDGKFAGAKLDTRLDERRLDLSAGRGRIEESFTRDVASLAEGYGVFQFESDNGGGAKVTGGRLRIDGGKPEGDQRLFVTSRRMIGRDRWPDQVEVRVKLAGEAGNNFGWHLGVSVGRVKTLFHPGQGRGGYFRAETTDGGHANIFPNEDMPFVPATGTIHEMVIRVTRTADGADFDVTVNDGNGGKPHRRAFKVTPEQLGKFNRIGLERSGRTGGDALFDSVLIQLGS